MNDEFIIISFDHAEHLEKMVEGFSVVFDTDIYDAGHRNYRAWLVGSNQVLVQVPTVRHGYSHCVGFIRALGQIEDNDEVIVNKHKAMMNRIKGKESHQKKTVLLQFPEHVVLQNTFSAGSNSNEIEIEYRPFNMKVGGTKDENGMAVTKEKVMEFFFGQFKVSVAKAEDLELKTGRKKKSNMADLIASTEHLAIDGEDVDGTD